MIEQESADKFYDHQNGFSCYVFPFKLMDEKYGRIEIQIEPIWGEDNKLTGMYVTAHQTTDPMWAGRLYRIDARADMFTGTALPPEKRIRDSYLSYVWMVTHCAEHGTVVFNAYPGNGHSRLIIPVHSSVMIDPYFE